MSNTNQYFKSPATATWHVLILLAIAIGFVPAVALSFEHSAAEFYPSIMAFLGLLGVIAARLRQAYASSAVGRLASAASSLEETEATVWLPRILSEVGPESRMADVRKAILTATSEALRTEMTALFTIDPFVGGIECEKTDAVTEDQQNAFLDLYGHLIADRDLKDPWVLENISKGEETAGSRRNLAASGIGSVIACPIRSETGASGALVAFLASQQVPRRSRAVIHALGEEASAIISYILAIEQSRYLLDDFAGVNRELSLQVTKDYLTGVANHRTLQQTLSALCRVSSISAEKALFSLVMIDVDNFKSYNDTNGHLEGDSVLQKVGQTLSSSVRSGDLAARYGGEEFALILRGAPKAEASVIADRIRGQIAQQPSKNGAVTISAGVAEFPADGATPSNVIESADRALYRAKMDGRNRVVVWNPAFALPEDKAA